jgi:hypothetical protein
VTVIDANLLLYAYNADSPQQSAAAAVAGGAAEEWRSYCAAVGDSLGIYSHSYELQNLVQPAVR